MMGRDAQGRFTRGNEYAAHGGRARAQALTAQERREIAAAGLAALAEQRFNGDKQAAVCWLSRVGVWAGLFGTEAARRKYARG